MADRGVSNERRRELEQMDPFQENLVKGMTWAAAHKKQLILALGSVVVVIVLFATTMYSFSRAETTAATLVAQAGAKHDKVYAEGKDPKAAYEAVKSDFQKIFEEYANTAAGKIALVSYAKICADAGDYDNAFTYYSKALESLGNEGGMENMLLAALGNMAMMKNDTETAKSFYQRIEKGSAELMKADARFALAQIYEAEKDTASSHKMYEEILQDNKDSFYRPIALARTGGE